MTEQVKTDDKIVIANRTFHPATKTTFNQDLYVLELIEGAEVEALTKATKDNLEDAALKVLTRATKSGKLFLLLAALIVEEGTKWTVESSKANAEFFGNLDEPADKEQLHGAIVGVLLSFFVNAEAFSKTSLKSSPAVERSRAPSSTSAARTKKREQAVASFGSEPGTS